MDFTGQSCSQYFDVVCVNRYYAWYSDPGHTELIARQLEYDLDGWFKRFNKPILMSEYGADTLNLYFDPSVMFTEQFQIEFMSHINLFLI